MLSHHKIQCILHMNDGRNNFFGIVAILLERLARKGVVLPPSMALLLSLQVNKYNQEHLHCSKVAR